MIIIDNKINTYISITSSPAMIDGVSVLMKTS